MRAVNYIYCKICNHSYHISQKYCDMCSEEDRNKERQKRYIENNPWIKHLNAIRVRCKSKPNYNGERRLIRNFLNAPLIKELWFRDKAWELDRPSIDRIDNDGDYIFENCRFIELKENTARGRAGQKPCLGKKFTQEHKDKISKSLKKTLKKKRVSSYGEERFLDMLNIFHKYNGKPNKMKEAISNTGEKK